MRSGILVHDGAAGRTLAWPGDFDIILQMYEERAGDPIFTMKLRSAGGAVGIGGLIYCVALLVYLGPAIFLHSSSPVTESIEERHDRWFGTQHEIEVRGARYWCSGGEAKYVRRRARVAYDATRPENCRAQEVLRTLGAYEVIAVMKASSFLVSGLAATVLWNRKRARAVAIAIVVLLAWSYLAVSLTIFGGRNG